MSHPKISLEDILQWKEVQVNTGSSLDEAKFPFTVSTGQREHHFYFPTAAERDSIVETMRSLKRKKQEATEEREKSKEESFQKVTGTKKK